MNDETRIRIISPHIETAQDGLTFNIVVFCQMCDQQIVKRVYTNMENPTQEQEQQMAKQRHKDAKKDSDIFCKHLERIHPDGIDIRLFRQAS